jgi:hypothetical protein
MTQRARTVPTAANAASTGPKSAGRGPSAVTLAAPGTAPPG